MRRTRRTPHGVRGQHERASAQKDNGCSHQPALPGDAATVRPVLRRSLRES
jgi:hypothetical protein